jgi:hypothetical protein
MFTSSTLRHSFGLFGLATAVLAGCSATATPDGEDIMVAESPLVSQTDVLGGYQADTKDLRTLNCGGGYCGVSTSTVPASGIMQLNDDHTWSCTGADCTFASPVAPTVLTSGTWAFPPSGDWRFIELSTGGTVVATAKVGEWYTLGQATLTVTLSQYTSGISGTYTQSVHFVHDLAGGSGGTTGPTCTDGIKNGSETGVDCGGTCSTKCSVGQACLVNSDCASNRCRSYVCKR